MKKISVKGLADFMTASAYKQRQIVRAYKYPSEDEASAKTLYYMEARKTIVEYHKQAHDVAWLSARAAALDTEAAANGGRRRIRLAHNARAVRAYARNFGGKKYDVLDPLFMELQYGDVFVTVVPDLHVREGGVEKVIKLEFNKGKPDVEVIKIVAQALFEAVKGKKLTIASKDALYVDVTNGTVHKGARMGARMAKNIEAACGIVSDIWDKI